ncbi:MAG: Wzy polymerase domain-containing protein [Polaromonas sp.]|nr:Wzy polymerase domain-containing protein [Polaromonas sp.]
MLLLVPWITPFASGPSPAFYPWLASWGAAGLLLLFSWNSRRIGASGRARNNVWPVAWGWLLAGAISSGLGLLQYFGAAEGFELWVAKTQVGEAFANLRQRNQFASLTSIALMALVWMCAHPPMPESSQRAGWRTAAFCFLAALLALGNATSESRTGLLQWLLLLVLMTVAPGWANRVTRRLAILVAVVYGVAVLVLPEMVSAGNPSNGLVDRLLAGDAECASRLTLWSNILHLIAQKPWLGWGWGELDYAHYITLYDGPRFCDILDNAHNLPLHLAVELGVPVAALVCCGFLWWVIRQKPWKETDATRQMAWAVMAVILLHSMLEYPLWYGPFQMAFGLCILLLWRRAPADLSGHAGDERVWPSGVWFRYRLVAGVLILASCAYAAWDYHRISQLYLSPAERSPSYRENTLEKARASWLFRNQVLFAELSITPLTRANAQWTYDVSQQLLHFSPEPRVIEKVIESATMLGRDDEAMAHLARFRAAFPADHAKWSMTAGSTAGL